MLNIPIKVSLNPIMTHRKNYVEEFVLSIGHVIRTIGMASPRSSISVKYCEFGFRNVHLQAYIISVMYTANISISLVFKYL